MHALRHLLITASAICALSAFAWQAHASGQGGGHGGGSDGGHGGGHGAKEVAVVEEIVEGVEVTLKLNLGTIEVINVEPTRRRTTRMSFDLHLTFPPETNPKEIRALDGWHHRLREQVIVGVRATDVNDFIDPELKRFRKQMLYRINRLLGGKPTASDVLFANFTFFSE